MNPLDINSIYVPVEMNIRIEFYRFRDPYYTDSYEPTLDIWVAYKETPKGYWIVPIYDFRDSDVNPRSKKWIMKNDQYASRHRKRFAHQTVEDALYSYYRKKLEHMRHLERKHSQLKTIVRKIETDHNIFGTERPIMDNIEDFFPRMRTSRNLEPLRRKRIIEEFINEVEMEI